MGFHYLLEFFIVFGDVLSMIALDVVRIETNTKIGYELSFNFATPDGLEVTPWHLVVAGFASFLLGLISDSFLGKIYLIIFGLICGVLSCSFCILNLSIDPSPRLPDRIMLLAYTSTSGIRTAFLIEQTEFTQIITGVRNLVFVLAYTRCLVRCFVPFLQTFGFSLNLISVYIGFAIFVFYSITFLSIVHKLYIEPTYPKIFCKVLSSIFIGFFRKIRSKKTQEKRVKFKFGMDKPEVIKEPSVSKSLWGYKQNSKPAASKSQTPKHWMEYSQPECNLYEIDQAKKFFNLFLAFLPPICMTIAILSILTVTQYQTNFVLWPEHPLVPNIVDFYLFFCAIFFPVCFFLSYLLMKFYKVKTWIFVLSGHVFLILALVVVSIVHLIFVLSLQDLPRNTTSQIRIFNEHKTSQVLTSIGETFNLEHLKYVMIKAQKEKKTTTIRFLTSETDKKSFQIPVDHTASYVYTKEGNLFINSNYDPTIFKVPRVFNSSHLYLVTSQNITAILEKAEGNKSVKIESKDRGCNFSIDAGEYIVTIENTNMSQNVQNLTLKNDALYAFFVAKEEENFVSTFITIEGPLKTYYLTLLVQLFFLSLADVIISWAYFFVLYMISPRKLRATVFSIVVALQFFSTALFIHLYFFWGFSIMAALIADFILCTIFIAVFVYMVHKLTLILDK